VEALLAAGQVTARLKASQAQEQQLVSAFLHHLCEQVRDTSREATNDVALYFDYRDVIDQQSAWLEMHLGWQLLALPLLLYSIRLSCSGSHPMSSLLLCPFSQGQYTPQAAPAPCFILENANVCLAGADACPRSGHCGGRPPVHCECPGGVHSRGQGQVAVCTYERCDDALTSGYSPLMVI